MATFALIHGGGSTAWDWHLVTPLLESVGHEVFAVDLPIEDPGAGLEDYADAVATAVGTRDRVIVVGHSLGGFTAPLAAEALRADGLVYFASMIPAPGESFMEWWSNTGHDLESIDDDEAVSFFNGVPEPLAEEARRRERDQQGDWMSRPWPGAHLPTIPTMAVLCTEDQFFPATFMRRQIRERLGIEPIEVPGGHYATLSHPDAVAEALNAFAVETVITSVGE
ncbi:alpha/beta fold hydrolase [Microbacterium murale]|uniref:Pimeloyl-ACP methyl ester carboxylesterase n=1 Tax=Microbacterium murale TaxID=1081040 RepID=A0ABU0P9Z2_9MICO|nr:alpha/beta hydrolase [Microbacterium murale]MDQ0643449.1 pimeloyl-ACP methyl ester carboxylesterase [Microbacterium murale]